jgi:hypothetical protein
MRVRRVLLAAASLTVACLLQPIVLDAQAPGFGGTWRLDEARSTVTADAGFFGLIGKGVPPTIHVTQPANGTLVVESQINEGHARLYAPRGRTTTPVGQAGTITMVSRWDGRSLVAEGTQESAAGTTTTVRQVKEVFALSEDGTTLRVTVSVTGGAAPSSSSLVFTRITSVGGCESWPTPCKRVP